MIPFHILTVSTLYLLYLIILSIYTVSTDVSMSVSSVQVVWGSRCPDHSLGQAPLDKALTEGVLYCTALTVLH